jgi:hypothetical protein
MTSIKERTEIAQANRRNVSAILEEIQILATISNDVAMSCFYVVFNKEDNKPFIGISVRFAELIASSWSNIQAGAKVVKNIGGTVTIQGFVHDFEKNSVFSVEVQRNIGRLSSEKAIQATNAASSIAFRNAVFKAVPAALFSAIAENVKNYITRNMDGSKVVEDVLRYFKKKGILSEDLENLIGNSISEADSKQLFLLIGLKNAIEEGDTTIHEVFNKGSKPASAKRTSSFVFDDGVEAESESEEPANDFEEVSQDMNNDSKSSKDKLKSGLASLSQSLPKEEVLQDEPKEDTTTLKKRPRGRTPKGMKWDEIKGEYVKEDF